LAEKTINAIREATHEATVRRLVERLNERIRAADSSLEPGPASTIGRFDPDETVRRWRAGQI